MEFSVQITNPNLVTISKHWARFVAWGFALVLIGLFAISAATLTTTVSVILLGCILLIGGIVVTTDSFTSWWGKSSGFFFHVILGLLYILVGFMLIKSPIAGSISITLLLGLLYIFTGILRLGYSLSLRLFNWGWSFINGIVTLLLGILILASWPASSLFIIGLFVGIDLVFIGISYIMAGFAAKNILKNT